MRWSSHAGRPHRHGLLWEMRESQSSERSAMVSRGQIKWWQKEMEGWTLWRGSGLDKAHSTHFGIVEARLWMDNDGLVDGRIVLMIDNDEIKSRRHHYDFISFCFSSLNLSWHRGDTAADGLKWPPAFCSCFLIFEYCMYHTVFIVHIIYISCYIDSMKNFTFCFFFYFFPPFYNHIIK